MNDNGDSDDDDDDDDGGVSGRGCGRHGFDDSNFDGDCGDETLSDHGDSCGVDDNYDVYHSDTHSIDTGNNSSLLSHFLQPMNSISIQSTILS